MGSRRGKPCGSSELGACRAAHVQRRVGLRWTRARSHEGVAVGAAAPASISIGARRNQATPRKALTSCSGNRPPVARRWPFRFLFPDSQSLRRPGTHALMIYPNKALAFGSTRSAHASHGPNGRPARPRSATASDVPLLPHHSADPTQEFTLLGPLHPDSVDLHRIDRIDTLRNRRPHHADARRGESRHA